MVSPSRMATVGRTRLRVCICGLGRLYRDGVVDARDAVILAQVNEGWLEPGGLVLFQADISTDDDAVPRPRLVGRRTVYRDHPRTLLCAYGVCGKALTIGHVVYLGLLVLEHTGGAQQTGVYGAGALVLEL